MGLHLELSAVQVGLVGVGSTVCALLGLRVYSTVVCRSQHTWLLVPVPRKSMLTPLTLLAAECRYITSQLLHVETAIARAQHYDVIDGVIID